MHLCETSRLRVNVQVDLFASFNSKLLQTKKNFGRELTLIISDASALYCCFLLLFVIESFIYFIACRIFLSFSLAPTPSHPIWLLILTTAICYDSEAAMMACRALAMPPLHHAKLLWLLAMPSGPIRENCSCSSSYIA